jgi:hypothetical protein
MIDSNVGYPTDSRYTLQWIVAPERQVILNRLPNNNDATFMNQQLSKPADLLLHYNYGAAAVKQWGKNTSVLTNRPDIPRPSVPTPAAMRPSRVQRDRSTAIQKRSVVTSEGQRGSGSKRTKRDERAAEDLEVQDKWDEDDVMLFFWGNSKAALERHAQQKEEHTKYLEAWRVAVARNPDMV